VLDSLSKMHSSLCKRRR